MKKIFTAVLLSILLTGAAISAEAVSKGFISVNVEASEELSPTVVKISFAVENQSKDPQEAANLNKQTSAGVINAIKALVNTENGETIKTTSYYLNPQYNYKDGVRKLTGYIASNTLQVSLKDVEKAGKVISTALSNGANSVNNLQFILEETNESCNKLIQEASKGAKTRADKIAESMGTTVTGIKSINASCSSNQGFHSNFRVMNAKAEASADMAAGNSMPVEAGKTQLKAYVNAEFFVK